MAIITAEIKINEILRTVKVHLYFPTDLPPAVGNEVKGVITLLHGISNTGSDWMQMSAACRYAADNGYVLVAPDAYNSFYVNNLHGPAWHDVYTRYLPQQLGRIFKLPTAREQNYIAGLSMGGYGAMLLAFMHPEKYAAVGSFSGSLDMSHVAQASLNSISLGSILEPVYGEEGQVPPELDLFQLAPDVAALPGAQQPRILCTCGTRDEAAIKGNRRFAQHVRGLPLDYTYLEWDGVHEWNYWDRSLAEFIGFIQGSDYARRKRADWSSEPADCT